MQITDKPTKQKKALLINIARGLIQTSSDWWMEISRHIRWEKKINATTDTKRRGMRTYSASIIRYKLLE